MSIAEFTSTINAWASERVPFLFLVDFEMKKPLAYPLAGVDAKALLYDFNGLTNAPGKSDHEKALKLGIRPVTLPEFQRKFSAVSHHLAYGDSYLANLTVRTALDVNCSLQQLFYLSKAKYKLLFGDSFLFFSPEIFVQIRDGNIFSYPMKGTIDAAIAGARDKILQDPKELAEHVTIVDLIRNDLSAVSHNVEVKRFRYIDELKTSDKRLLQVSSEIVGRLDEGYRHQLGSLLVKLLPAGSVSGAPKDKTVEIIRQAEGEDRGYYTGVAGIFDGRCFDSCVMIRFIERNGNQLYYRSGGGITAQSVMEKEYQEIIDKVYVPVN
jgi:para-aminobenzoate synthetase component 1